MALTIVLVGDESFSEPDSTDDWIILGGTGANLIITGNGDNRVSSRDGDDFVITYGGDDVISLGSGNDLGSSWGGDDTMLGGAGNDALNGVNDVGDKGYFDGGTGDDHVIFFGYGQATLIGGRGNDVIAAAGGKVTLIGGDGVDEFVFGPSGAFMEASILGLASNEVIDLSQFDVAQSDLSLSQGTLVVGEFAEIWVGPRILGVQEAIDSGMIVI